MSTVLAWDPDVLEATALDLRRAAAELDLAAGQVIGCTDVAWSGLAALEQAARCSETSGAVRQLVTPLERVSAALVEVAVAAREHGGTVRRHTRLREELGLERSRVLALAAISEPIAAAQLAERVRLLEEELAWHQGLIEAAEREFDRAQRRAADLLDQVRAHVPQIVWDLALTFATAHKAVDGWKQASGAAGLAATARRLQRMRVPGGERTLQRTQERIEEHVRRLQMRPPGWVAKIPGGAALAGRAVPLVAAFDAGRGVATGGGYDGWRGRTTRVLGAVGMVGAGVAVVSGVVAVGAAAPVAGVVGLSAAAIYQAWMTGNWIYDNRQRIASTASRAGSGTRQLGGRVWSRGRSGLGRARERARSGLDRLRERHGRTSDRDAERSGSPVAPGTVPIGAQA